MVFIANNGPLKYNDTTNAQRKIYFPQEVEVVAEENIFLGNIRQILHHRISIKMTKSESFSKMIYLFLPLVWERIIFSVLLS